MSINVWTSRREKSETLVDNASLKTEGALRRPAPTMIASHLAKARWQQFYELARRPPAPSSSAPTVYQTGLNRVAPAQGYSLSELDDAGVDRSRRTSGPPR
jgi:hypothetical protein